MLIGGYCYLAVFGCWAFVLVACLTVVFRFILAPWVLLMLLVVGFVGFG